MFKDNLGFATLEASMLTVVVTFFDGLVRYDLLWSLRFLRQQTQGGFRSFDIIDKGD